MYKCLHSVEYVSLVLGGFAAWCSVTFMMLVSNFSPGKKCRFAFQYVKSFTLVMLASHKISINDDGDWTYSVALFSLWLVYMLASSIGLNDSPLAHEHEQEVWSFHVNLEIYFCGLYYGERSLYVATVYFLPSHSLILLTCGCHHT